MRRSRWRSAVWATTSASTMRSGCTRRWPTGRQRRSTWRGRPPGRGPADAQSRMSRPPLALTYFGLPTVLTMGTTLTPRAVPDGRAADTGGSNCPKDDTATVADLTAARPTIGYDDANGAQMRAVR